MLNFLVFDIYGNRLGGFELKGGRIVSQSTPPLSPAFLGFLNSIYVKDGERGIRTYANSLQAYESGFILRENPGAPA